MAKRQAKSATSSTKATSAKPAVAASVQASAVNTIREVKPSREQVARRAYELYSTRLARGERGTPESDWYQAEQELISER